MKELGKLRRFNMVVVPGAGRSLYNVVVSYHFLYFVGALAIVIIGSNLLLLTGYMGLRGSANETRRAEEMDSSLIELSEKAQRISRELEQIREIEQRIQDKTGISTEPDYYDRAQDEDYYDGLSSRGATTDLDLLRGRLDEVDAEIESRKRALLSAEKRIESQLEDHTNVPSMSPIRNGEITSGFGYRIHPISGTWEFHEGIDIRGNTTTPIYATADGIVMYSDWRQGYGRMVGIDHRNGYFTLYAHNSRNLVVPGERVRKGQIIAYVGSTGSSTGNHVHYEVHFNDRLQNPVKFLRVAPRDLGRF